MLGRTLISAPAHAPVMPEFSSRSRVRRGNHRRRMIGFSRFLVGTTACIRTTVPIVFHMGRRLDRRCRQRTGCDRDKRGVSAVNGRRLIGPPGHARARRRTAQISTRSRVDSVDSDASRRALSRGNGFGWGLAMATAHTSGPPTCGPSLGIPEVKNRSRTPMACRPTPPRRERPRGSDPPGFFGPVATGEWRGSDR